MKRSVILGLASLLVAGGVAVAAIPGPDGVIHSCMLKKIGTIRIIDPSQGQKCNDKLETPLGWNQIGRPGTNGTNGTNGTDGADGNSAYQIWLDLGNTGTEQDFIDSLRGPRGNDGADGNLALAGQSCPQGLVVTGFDQAGNIVCGDEGGGGGGGGPQPLTVTPDSLDFGTVAMGAVSTLHVNLTNPNDTDWFFTMQTSNPVFSLTSAEGAVPAEGTIAIEVSFVPVEEGATNGILTISDGQHVVNVFLGGVGVP